jgi:DMSO reductase family type II enzyme heme b subunit
VGQVIHKARWFAPAVEDVWIQAVHDGKSIAFRVTWDDRSQSPDHGLEHMFTRRLLATVASDDSTPPALAPWPDQLAVQFPVKPSEGMERPYFLMGGSSDPVYQWRWSSLPRRAVAGLARGIERFDSLPSDKAPASRLSTIRAVARGIHPHPCDCGLGQRTSVRRWPGYSVAFFAWDGSSAERGTRMAVSTWYFLALDQPTPPGRSFLP